MVEKLSSAATEAKFSQIMYGTIPAFEGNNAPDYKVKLIKALNWTSRNLEPSQARKELLQWMLDTGYVADQINAIKRLSENENQTDGKLAFLINNQWILEADMLQRMRDRLTAAIAKGEAMPEPEVVETFDDEDEQPKKGPREKIAPKPKRDEYLDGIMKRVPTESKPKKPKTTQGDKLASAVIRVLTNDFGHRPGSKAEVKSNGFRDGMTVAEYMANDFGIKGKWHMSHINHCLGKGFIKLEE